MSQDAEHWRGKYYTTLGELENREGEWGEREKQLRYAISRLTLAADQSDPVLTRHLTELRNALRKGRDIGELENTFESIYNGIQKLDEIRQPSTPVLLEELFEKLKLPRSAKVQVREFRRELADFRIGEPYQPVLQSLAGLLNELLAGDMQPEAGLEAAREILERIIETMLANGADAAGLIVQLDVADCKDEMLAVAEAIAGYAGSAGVTVDEALLRLLERLEIPEEQQGRVEAIKEVLNNGFSGTTVNSAITDIAELVGNMRSGIQQEKEELETFLKQLGERLQELDKSLRHDMDEQRDSIADGRAFNDALREQIRSLSDHAAEARDLEGLKNTLRGSLDTISEYLERHRRQEDSRLQHAEARVTELTGKLGAMETEVDKLRRRVVAERRQAQTDPLTRIPNRLAYNERLALEMARSKRYGSPFCIAVWDVDRFKSVNDNYGHKAGDKVLTVVAKLLRRQVRDTDFVARLGGEEFVMLLTESTLEQAKAVSETLRQSVAEAAFHHSGKPVAITISCGLAQFRDGDSEDTLFHRADRALYAAKEAGRNCCIADER